MKKFVALLLAVLLLFATGCAPAEKVSAETPSISPATPAPTVAPTPAPTPNTDLTPLLSMTREQVEAAYGKGEPVPFADISDYNETGYAIFGFPAKYEKLGDVLVFFNAAAPDEQAAPYYCTEAPTDAVIGVMLPKGSAPWNVDGAVAQLDADIIKNLETMFGAKVEYVEGMYEYYQIKTTQDGVVFEWRSDHEDMADADLYASKENAGSMEATEPVTGLILLCPVLTKNIETYATENRADGTYLEDLGFDGMVNIKIERVAPVEFDKEAVKKQIAALNLVPIKNFQIEQDEELSQQLSYPAWLVIYETGENEDTRQCADVYIQTDEWDFWFGTATPIDAFDEYRDGIEFWFKSLKLTEAE